MAWTLVLSVVKLELVPLEKTDDAGKVQYPTSSGEGNFHERFGALGPSVDGVRL